MPRGTVKWFNDEKGYGFIIDPAIPSDILVHWSVIEGEGYRTLEDGEEVEYELASDGAGKMKAARVIRIHPPRRAKKTSSRKPRHSRKHRPDRFHGER